LADKALNTNRLAGWEDGGLTEDYLLGGSIQICQPKDGFRATIDTVLMAASVPAAGGHRIFEAGSGNGAAAICLGHRVPSSEITGIEIQPNMVTLAGHNIRLNQLQKKVKVMIGDIGGPPPPMLRGPFDHAMANPPFLGTNEGRVPNQTETAIAKTFGTTDFSDWIAGIHLQLKRKGTLTLVWRADKLHLAIAALMLEFGDIRVFPLWPKPGRPAKRVLVRARKGVKTPMTLLPGLVLHQADGSYTSACEAVLKGGSSLDF
jgi:tRNA1(Val) A37 N6-methylase TrmN6